MNGIVRFVGRRFEFVGMASKPARDYPGYVEMRDLHTSKVVTARADMVTVETPEELLATVRERLAGIPAVDWARVRRATALPAGERDEFDQAIVDAFVD